MAHAIGLSVGAAKLAAVAIGSAAVTRSAVLTRFPHRPPEVGLPSENPDLDERGLIITDFVDRVGDPVEIVASDGSSYLAAELLADALCALLYAVTRGQTLVDPIGVTYPVRWRPPAVDALRRALARRPEFDQRRPLVLVPDAVAALTALQDDPGVPSDGVIAVCDFGATGTSITLADAARDFEPIAATVRDSDLSGGVVDQALLTLVIADLAAARSIDLSDASVIGSLSRLRSQCRAAKERLSTSPVASLTVDLPGRRRTEVRVTRNDLDEALEQPLAGFVDVLYDTLRRNRIHQNDLVAVASVGGGARMPVVTATLSEHLNVPVITSGHPDLNAAIGAGLEGLHASLEGGVASVTAKGPASGLRELEWSGSKRDSDPIRVRERRMDDPPLRPRFDADDVHADDVHPDDLDADDADIADDEPPAIWYRHPFALLAAGVSLVLALTVTAAVFVLVRDDSPAPASTSASTSRTTPTTTQPPPAPETSQSTVVIPPLAPSPLDPVTEQAPRVPYTQAPATTTAVPPAPSIPPSESTTAPPPEASPSASEGPTPNAPSPNTEAPAAPPAPAVPPNP